MSFGQDLPNHKVNDNANLATNIRFQMENPVDTRWYLELSCTPFFKRDGTGLPLTPLVVNRSGSIIHDAFENGETVRMYDWRRFQEDRFAGDRGVTYDGRIGSWDWSRFEHDIKVEAQPGMGVVNDTYVSVFTWTMINGP